MSPVIVLLGLGAGVYYLVTRRPSPKNGTCPEGWHYMPDGSCMRDEDMAAYKPGPDAYNPPGWDALLGTYQACVYGHCSGADCTKLKSYLDSLVADTSDERAWIEARRDEVNRSCPAVSVPNLYPTASSEAPPLLPSWIPNSVQETFNTCWIYMSCSTYDFEKLANAMTSVITNYQGMVPPSQTNQAYVALSSLRQRYQSSGIAVAGVAHVGNCGCAECQAAAGAYEDDEPCCEACARGSVGACACKGALQDEEEVGA